MAYDRSYWKDHVTDQSGEVIQQGTLLDQQHFNNMELGISDMTLAGAIMQFKAAQDGYNYADELHTATLAQTGTVNSKEIIGTNVVVFVNVPNFGQADTITGVRVYDINGALAGQQSISLKRTSLNVALLRFTFPLIETEE